MESVFDRAEWHAAMGDGSTSGGPFSVVQLADAMDSGQVHTGTLVWGPGMADWVPLSDCRKLSALIHAEYAKRDVRPQRGNHQEASQPKQARPASKHADNHKTGGDSGASWVILEGLPMDCTPSELERHLTRCGPLRIDPLAGKPIVVLFRSSPAASSGLAAASTTEELLAGAVAQFLDQPSVALSVTLLDWAPLRPRPGQSTIRSDTPGAAGGYPLRVRAARDVADVHEVAGIDPSDPFAASSDGVAISDAAAAAAAITTAAADAATTASSSSSSSSGTRAGRSRPKRSREDELRAQTIEAEQRARLSWDDDGVADHIAGITDVRHVVLRGLFDQIGRAHV